MRSLYVSLAAVAVVLGGCSFSFGSSSDPLDSVSAAELVNEEFTEDIGLGELSTECDVPDDVDDGDAITCTSTTPDGDVIEWSGAATGTRTFDIETTNLLRAGSVEDLERDVVESMVNEGLPVTDGDLDCGDQARVLDASNALVCAVTDPRDGAVYDITITVDFDNASFGFVIADEPRS